MPRRRLIAAALAEMGEQAATIVGMVKVGQEKSLANVPKTMCDVSGRCEQRLAIPVQLLPRGMKPLFLSSLSLQLLLQPSQILGRPALSPRRNQRRQ